MCDYSLHSVSSRPARVGDRLKTHDFGTGTRGLADVNEPSTAVCLLPGTELAFAQEVRLQKFGLLWSKRQTMPYKTAVFRRVNEGEATAHHDALEFPDGKTVMLTFLPEGQEVTVLQLPARSPAPAAAEPAPTAAQEAKPLVHAG